MTETPQERPCATCQYHRINGGGITAWHLCDNPQYEIEDYNYVTGERRYISPSCYDLREKKGACGYEGHGWIYKGADLEEYEPLLFEIKRKIKRFIEVFNI